MSAWQDALVYERQAEAKKVYAALQKFNWADLSRSDQRVMEAIGYLCLEGDGGLAGLLDADIGEVPA